jgi:hypothetical protein
LIGKRIISVKRELLFLNLISLAAAAHPYHFFSFILTTLEMGERITSVTFATLLTKSQSPHHL